VIWIGDTLVSLGEAGVYGERVLAGHRVWDPYRSKLGALYHLGKGIDLHEAMRVLYLGAAHGTTVSHVSDYVEVVYAIEKAPLPMQDLLAVAGRRRNIIPVMADAAHPDKYVSVVEEVDLIFQDVASPAQADIAVRNRVFLAPGGILLLVVKTRAIDSAARPEDVEAEVGAVIRSSYTLLDSTWLLPYHRDHVAFLCKR
jgi:fibrillarin-like pre-rRNA processing protein